MSEKGAIREKRSHNDNIPTLNSQTLPSTFSGLDQWLVGSLIRCTGWFDSITRNTSRARAVALRSDAEKHNHWITEDA